MLFLIKTVLKGKHVKIEMVRAYISQFSYTDVMINTKLLAVVTLPYTYQDASNMDTY